LTTAWGSVESGSGSGASAETFFYAFAIIAGALAGWIDVKLSDLLFTALLVLAPCMLLGVLRPARPWRWVVLVSIGVPIVDFLFNFFYSQRPYDGEKYAAMLVFLPAFAGAYGGSLMRGVINNLWGNK
jgi:hypothetical protein